MHLNFLDIFALTVPLALLQVALILWVKNRVEFRLNHEYAAKQASVEPENHREIRIEHLLAAYRKLEAAALREDLSPYEDGMESAIAEIQLLGNANQANLAAGFAQALASTHKGDLTKLLQDLRNDLRREFSLDPLPGRPIHMRLMRKEIH